jgi:hypothetical protein
VNAEFFAQEYYISRYQLRTIFPRRRGAVRYLLWSPFQRYIQESGGEEREEDGYQEEWVDEMLHRRKEVLSRLDNRNCLPRRTSLRSSIPPS